MAGEGWAGMLTGLGGTVLQGFQEQKQKQLKEEEAQLGMHLHMFEQMYQDPDKYSRAHLESTLAVLDKNPALKKMLGMAPSEAAKPLLDERDKQLEGMRKAIATTSLANNPPSGNMIANSVNGDPTQKAVDQFDAIATGGSMLDARSFYASLLGEQRKTAAEATQYAQQRQLAQDRVKWGEESELRMIDQKLSRESAAKRAEYIAMYGDPVRWPQNVKDAYLGIRDYSGTGRLWAEDPSDPNHQIVLNKDGTPAVGPDGQPIRRRWVAPGSVTPAQVVKTQADIDKENRNLAHEAEEKLAILIGKAGKTETYGGGVTVHKTALDVLGKEAFNRLQREAPYEEAYKPYITREAWESMLYDQRKLALAYINRLGK